MALFGRSKPQSPSGPSGILDPQWVRSPEGDYWQFQQVKPDALGLRGQGGVYVLWHGGLKPTWVYAGESTSLGRALTEIADNKDIIHYRARGGLFVTWAVASEELRRGILLYLTRAMKPLVTNPRAPTQETEHTKLIPVVIPGGKQTSR